MDLEQYWCASFVVIGTVGWSICFILRFICSGFRSGSFAFSECSFVVVLHSFPSFASLPICIISARNIGGVSGAGIGVSCPVGCIGHILVAML